MHGDTTELLAHDLALPGVNACANVNAQLPDRVHNCLTAADGTRRTIKCRQEAVPGSIDFTTSMPGELFTNKGMMLGEQVFPISVTEFDKPLRSVDNVREQYAGKDAVTLCFNVATLASQKRFNFSED
jgi:hypothetical protein